MNAELLKNVLRSVDPHISLFIINKAKTDSLITSNDAKDLTVLRTLILAILFVENAIVRPNHFRAQFEPESERNAERKPADE
jgi:hypothetical protein